MTLRSLAAIALATLLAACGSGEGDERGMASASPSSPSEAAFEVAADSSHQLLNRPVVPSQPGRFAPRDECADLPGATEFRWRLAAAVIGADAETIVAMAAPGIRLGFGGNDGRERLRERLRAPEYLREWREVLELGCAKGPAGGLTMPWHFAQETLGDPYSAMLVMGSDVPLRASSDNGAAVRERIDWDFVQLAGSLKPNARFQAVRSAQGQEGYVATSQLRSALDYRLLAVPRDGNWEITAFVAGD